MKSTPHSRTGAASSDEVFVIPIHNLGAEHTNLHGIQSTYSKLFRPVTVKMDREISLELRIQYRRKTPQWKEKKTF